MMNIRVEKQPREGEEAASRLDVAAYTKSVFGMYGGSPADVTLRFENSLVGVVIVTPHVTPVRSEERRVM